MNRHAHHCLLVKTICDRVISVVAWIFIIQCISAPVFAQKKGVEAVIDENRVVVACSVDGVRVLNADKCPEGDARISDMIPAKAGEHKVLFFDGVLRRGPALNAANPATCRVMIGEKQSRRSFYAQADAIVIDEIPPENLTIRTQLRFALNFNAVKLMKILEIKFEAEDRRVLYIHGSNIDDALEYHNKTGEYINYYEVAGFLKKNKDGRPFLDVIRGGIGTDLNDSRPIFALLGFIYLEEKVSLVIAGGLSINRSDYVLGMNHQVEGTLQRSCN